MIDNLWFLSSYSNYLSYSCLKSPCHWIFGVIPNAIRNPFDYRIIVRRWVGSGCHRVLNVCKWNMLNLCSAVARKSGKSDLPNCNAICYKQFHCLEFCQTFIFHYMKKCFKQKIFVSRSSTKKYSWLFIEKSIVLP